MYKRQTPHRICNIPSTFSIICLNVHPSKHNVNTGLESFADCIGLCLCLRVIFDLDALSVQYVLFDRYCLLVSDVMSLVLFILYCMYMNSFTWSYCIYVW